MLSLRRALLYAFLPLALSAAPQTSASADSQGAADQKCLLSGRVSNSLTGEPLKKVSIQLMPRGGVTVATSASGAMQPSGVRQGYSTISLADGSFAIENIEPGDYILSGRRTGYLYTQYGGRGPLSAGSVLTLKAGQQKTDLNLALVPQAVIIGKVVDEDGDPLEGVTVQAIRPQWRQGRMSDMPQANAQTNDLGEFRLSGVRPGKLYIVAQRANFQAPNLMQGDRRKPERRPVRTFYPEAVSRDAATPIDVQAGQDLTGIDIRMQTAQTYHIRGRVAGMMADADGEHVMMFVRPRDEGFAFMPGNQVVLGKEHTFDIPGIAPGSYELIVQSMGGRNRFGSQQEIEVGAGDLNDIVVTIQTPATLRGTIRFDGTPSSGAAVNLTNIQIRLTPADPFPFIGQFPRAKAGADGAFTLENVSPGKYKLVVNPLNDAYLKSVKLGNQEMLGKYLDIGAGGAGELDILARYGTAELDGSVQADQNAAASQNGAGAQAGASANILLAPEELNEDGSGLRFGSVGAGGSFRFQQLAPGRYKAYAFEDASYADLQNPDVIKQIESKGADVELAEKDKKQIQLPLISADEFQQVLAKLGLDSSQ